MDFTPVNQDTEPVVENVAQPNAQTVLPTGQTVQPVFNANAGPTIKIKTTQNKVVTVPFDSTMTIGQVKDYVHSQTQIGKDQMRLIYNGKQLENTDTLSACGIVEDDTLHLVLRLRG